MMIWGAFGSESMLFDGPSHSQGAINAVNGMCLKSVMKSPLGVSQLCYNKLYVRESVLFASGKQQI